MKKSGLFAILLLFVVTSVGNNAPYSTKFSIFAIRAHLYYQSTGAINPTNLLDGRAHALWNTPIGGGEARLPSQAVWMLVDIIGPSFSENLGLKLFVNVTNDGRTLLDQTLTLDDWFCECNRLVVPFLIYGTGCGNLEITARLEGLPAEKADIAALKKTIQFACGE